MHLTALLIALFAAVAIIVLGARFILQPRQATLDFGIAADDLRGLTEIKGARDIASGVVLLVAWAAAGPTALGWVLGAAAITPTADALIVLTNGGKLGKALGVHGLTAALLVAPGVSPARAEATQPTIARHWTAPAGSATRSPLMRRAIEVLAGIASAHHVP